MISLGWKVLRTPKCSGLFHSTVFDFVKEDVRKNTQVDIDYFFAFEDLVHLQCQGTRDRFLAKPAESSTLEDLVINEKAEGLEASTGALIRVLRWVTASFVTISD